MAALREACFSLMPERQDHARLLAPMRACFAQASRGGLQVRDGVSG